MKIKELKDQISHLPAEQRIEIAKAVLKTFDPADPEVDEAWLKETWRRMDEFEQGKIKTIPGEEGA